VEGECEASHFSNPNCDLLCIEDKTVCNRFTVYPLVRIYILTKQGKSKQSVTIIPSRLRDVLHQELVKGKY
jgi:hypothetical protein